MKKIIINKKNEKKFEILITIFAFFVFAMMIFIPICIILPLSFWYKPIGSIFPYFFYGGLFLSPLIVIIPCFFTTTPLLKRKEPIKYEYNDNYLFEENLIKELLNEEYILYKNTIIGNIEIYIYIKEIKNIKKIVAKIKTQEFDNDMINIIDKYISKMLSKIKSRYVYFIPIIIVEEETIDLKEWLKSLDFQDEFKYRILVGFIKNKNELYISNQNTRLGITNYNKVKKRIFINYKERCLKSIIFDIQ